MPIDRTYASERMNALILGGFRPPDEIEQIIVEECFRPEDVTEDDAIWVGQEVARAWAAKLEQEKNWPAITDWDKLDAAFKALDRAGIIALHQAGMTLSDGISDVTEEYHARGAEDSSMVGYCFYHQQDVEHAIEGRGLMLAFGHIKGDPAEGVEIGRRIVVELTKAGFRITWDGTIHQRINIDNLRWQKRYQPLSD